MEVSDAAKECSDAVNLACLLDGVGKWVAVRLSDGKSDGKVYDTRPDAIRHQLHESQCAYIKVPPGGMPRMHAEKYLAVHRKLYEKGFRLTDPDSTATPIMPYTDEGLKTFLKG